MLGVKSGIGGCLLSIYNCGRLAHRTGCAEALCALMATVPKSNGVGFKGAHETDAALNASLAARVATLRSDTRHCT